MQGRRPRNQNILLQKPDGLLVSHRTLSLSPALQVLTCRNACPVYLGGILGQPRELREPDVLGKWRGLVPGRAQRTADRRTDGRETLTEVPPKGQRLYPRQSWEVSLLSRFLILRMQPFKKESLPWLLKEKRAEKHHCC